MVDALWHQISALPAFLLEHSGSLLLLSLATLLLTLVLLPVIIGRLPVDYFAGPRPRHHVTTDPVLSVVLFLGRNIVGAALILLGLVMLVTPGQGLVTLFVGLLLMDYPGKHALEQSLVRRDGVMAGLNWVRRKGGHPPLEPPPGWHG